MQFRYLFTLLLVFSVNKYVLCRLLTGLNKNNVIPNDMAKDFRLEEFIQYLNKLSDKETLTDTKITFPRSLQAAHYRLSDGKVDRYYDPLKLHGIYNRVILNSLDGELFGIVQVYSPKIDMSFTYDTTQGRGSFSFIITHDPLQVSMDLGIIKNGHCEITKGEHEATYFYFKKNIKLLSKFKPESETGMAVLKEIEKTWLPQLYGIIVKSRIQNLIQDVKNTLLQNPQKFPDLKIHCTRVH